MARDIGIIVISLVVIVAVILSTLRDKDGGRE